MSLDLNLRRWAESKGFRYLANSFDPKLIIFGEEHFKDELIKAQVELIRFLQPDYVLHEFQGDRPYSGNPMYQSLVIGNNEDSEIHNNEINLFRLLSQQLGFQLIGADLSARQSFSRPYDSVEDIHRYREIDGMARTMIEYTRKSRKPVIAIVGTYHSHPASPIHPILESEGIHYCVIQQAEAERFLREPKISLRANPL